MPRGDTSASPFAGPGEMRELCRAKDWSATTLGPVHTWSEALLTTVRTCLASPFPTCLWCGTELVLIYNDAYQVILGSKHPTALGNRGFEVWREIWDIIAPMFDDIRAGGPPVYSEDAPFVVERETEASDAWFTFALSPVRDDAGEIVAFLNIVSETTERVLGERETEASRLAARNAENRLREVFTQAPSFLAVLQGPDLVFEYVNAAYYQLVGHRELLGLPVFEALPEVRGQGFEEILTQVLETGETFVGRESSVFLSRATDSEPEQRFLDFVYYAITEADGSRTGVVAHGSDVTDHVTARHEAQRARAEAEEANLAKSQFLANMSHEIRTPINAIIGYTDLLEMGIAGPVTEGQKKQLERVRTSSQHLLMLIEDVLDLAKVEAGRMNFDREPILTSDTIGAALALVRPQAEQGNIQVVEVCDDDSVPVYVGDADRVCQILANLLSNAVKFTESGGEIRITCGLSEAPDSSREVAADGVMTYIRVSDSGIGIEPNEIDAIFKPFAQAEMGHTRTRGGTGLGLTISQQLARSMGGDLTAESEPGVGSTFTLWLPSEHTAPSLEDRLLGDKPEPLPENLALVGHALQGQMREVLDRFRAALISDPDIPMASSAAEADLEDHASTFLADIAHSLIVLETGEIMPERLLQDGSEIQRLVSTLHGKQRAELGWTEEAFAREWELLRGEIRATVRKATHNQEIGGALRLLERFLERAERISHRSFRNAASIG